jgi:hypothetical protein
MSIAGFPIVAELAADGQLLCSDVAARGQGGHRGDDQRQGQSHPPPLPRQSFYRSGCLNGLALKDSLKLGILSLVGRH